MLLPIAYSNIALVRPAVTPAIDALAKMPRRSQPKPKSKPKIALELNLLYEVSIETKSGIKSSAISTADIQTIFGSQYGKTVDPTALKKSIDKLKALYEARGYELAEIVDIQELTPAGKLVVVVTEGVIEDIQVRFLDRDRKLVDDKGKPIKGVTRDFIITREIELKSSEIYNNKNIERDLRRLYRLGIFEDLKLSFVPGKKDPDRSIVQIDVVESTNFGGLTFRDRFGSNVELSPAIGYGMNNLGGNNQKITADVVVSDGNKIGFNGFNLSYRDPWIAGDPHRTSYEVNVFSRRSQSLIFGGGKTPTYSPNSTDIPLVSRTGAGITFTRSIDGNPYHDNGWQGSVGFGYQKVSIENTDGKVTPLDSKNQQLSFSNTGRDDLLTAQIGLSKDTRDDRLQPTQGSLLKFDATQSIPIGMSNITFSKLTGSYTHYVPVNLLNFDRGAQTVAFNLQGGTALGDLPPYEAFALGGVSSVRGYEEAGLGAGRSYLRASTEYQFPIFALLGGAVFADYGTDFGTGKTVRGDPAGIRGKPGSGFGYGAGLRLNLPWGALQLNFALNDRGERLIQFGLSDR